MKRFLTIFLCFCWYFVTYGQLSGTKIIEFSGSYTSSERLQLDVPTGKLWLIYNSTLEALELGDSQGNWVTVGGSQTGTLQTLTSGENQVTLSDGGGTVTVDTDPDDDVTVSSRSAYRGIEVVADTYENIKALTSRNDGVLEIAVVTDQDFTTDDRVNGISVTDNGDGTKTITLNFTLSDPLSATFTDESGSGVSEDNFLTDIQLVGDVLTFLVSGQDNVSFDLGAYLESKNYSIGEHTINHSDLVMGSDPHPMYLTKSEADELYAGASSGTVGTFTPTVYGTSGGNYTITDPQGGSIGTYLETDNMVYYWIQFNISDVSGDPSGALAIDFTIPGVTIASNMTFPVTVGTMMFGASEQQFTWVNGNLDSSGTIYFNYTNGPYTSTSILPAPSTASGQIRISGSFLKL